MEVGPLIREDFVSFDKEDNVSSMIGMLKSKKKRSGLVFDKKKFLGIVEDKRLLKSRFDATNTKILKLVKKIPLVSEHLDIIEAAYLMHQSNVNFLPVGKGKKIVGVLYGLDVIRRGAELDQLKNIKVNDVKLSKPSKLKNTDKIATAISIMFNERVEQIPVLVDGKLGGIISFRDVLKKYDIFPAKREVGGYNSWNLTRAFTSNRPEMDKLPVESFSTMDSVAVIGPEEELFKGIDLMYQNNLTNLVVVKNDEILGLLTLKNILRRIGSLKIPKNFNIKFIGLRKTSLEPYQKYNIERIAANESFKLQRAIHNDFDITLHIKEYNKSGRQQKFSVHMRLEYPGQIITSEQDDWDIETAVRKTFNNAKNATKKKFKGDSPREKPYE